MDWFFQSILCLCFMLLLTEVGHRISGVVEHEVIVCIAVWVAQVACGAGGMAPGGPGPRPSLARHRS